MPIGESLIDYASASASLQARQSPTPKFKTDLEVKELGDKDVFLFSISHGDAFLFKGELHFLCNPRPDCPSTMLTVWPVKSRSCYNIPKETMVKIVKKVTVTYEL